MIYEPEEDSFLLAKHVKKYARGKVLDLGCGSCILSEEARKKTEHVTAADINPEAVALAKKKGFKAVQTDLFENIKGRFNLIIFNPPYLPEAEGEDEESRQITTGGKKGNETLERFLQEAKEHLSIGGEILLVVSSHTPVAEELFRRYDYKFRMLDKKNLFFEKLFVYALR